MKLVLFILVAGVLLISAKRLLAGGFLSPAEAAARVAAGTAVVIDVREPAEWTAGVVEGALLLPLSDLRGDRVYWTDMLATHREKELILYCRSGNRSAIAASLLSADGYRTSNAGGYAAWKAAGQSRVAAP